MRRRGASRPNEDAQPLLQKYQTQHPHHTQTDETNWGGEGAPGHSTVPSSSSWVSWNLVSGSYSYLTNLWSSAWSTIHTFWSQISKYVNVPSTGPSSIAGPKAEMMGSLKKYLSKTFDESNAEHLKDLQQLWLRAFPDAPFPDDLISDTWKRIGFQSDDPRRDFRATGLLGLQNILFLAEKYPARFSDLLDLSERKPGEHYPFVVASFNITMLLFELLGWGWKTPGASTATEPRVLPRLADFLFPSVQYTPESAANVFDELYCVAIGLLDEVWFGGGHKYMDFPVVMKTVQGRFEKIVLEFNSLEDVFSYNQRPPKFY
uniref:ELMO domain-containing protein n=1 Tax=Arcella intermedia TaxID=1963864 RepID=A0A6B2LA80_9EUKA